MSFDTERLIREVECRKALWDISSEEYSDRDLKKRSWEEITNIFCEENASENEKKDVGKLYIYIFVHSDFHGPYNYSYSSLGLCRV
jgi:hypothetical protein